MKCKYIVLTLLHTLTTGNLIRNGDFSQIESNGRPMIWNYQLGKGNNSIIVLQRKYLNLNAVEISIFNNETLVTMTQIIHLEIKNMNKNLLLISFWYSTWIRQNSGSIRLDFYNKSNQRIISEYIKSLANNLIWTYVQIKKLIHPETISVKIIIQMNRCLGRILIANISLEQIDFWKKETFIITPRSDASLFIQWNFIEKNFSIDHYDIYRGIGILSKLNQIDLLVTIPTMNTYGKNIYESMYTDYTVRLNQIYTYQIIARNNHGMIINQTDFKIGQADLGFDYYNTTILLAFPRYDGIHLIWKLPIKSQANSIILYNGIDNLININSSQAHYLGRYSKDDMKVILPLIYHGPFLLISDNEKNIAIAKLANLSRPRLMFTQTRLIFIRKQIQQSKHAQQVFNALIQNIHKYQPNNLFNFCWLARDAALIYAITNEKKYIHRTYSTLNINRQNYTIYDNSAIKLRFAHSTMARAQAFDWAYHGFTIEQRRELIKDFLYAASIFTSYTDDHSRNPNDKSSNWIGIIKSSELILHLTLYGEEDYPNNQAEQRILFLLNELKLHLEHAYSPSGYTQEGLNYLSYTISLLGPAVYSAKDMGISILDQAWSRPDWANLALHVISFRKQRNALQFGVSDSIYSYNGFLPYIFNSTTDINIKAALRWFYDRTMGIKSIHSVFDGKDKCAALLFYPYEIIEQHPSQAFPRSMSMLIDNLDGYYAFRNRYQDHNDVLIGFTSRNRCHAGWNAEDTFALSILSHDTTWTQMPGKEYKIFGLTRKFSTPLIDGLPREPTRDQLNSKTKFVKTFTNQGGGYVSIDASRTFRIISAQRNILVDMIQRNSIDTIIVIDDYFRDNTSHYWHWQLSPNWFETNFLLTNENQLSTFIIRGRNQTWLKAWLYNFQNATFNNTNETIRILKYGFQAHFQIIMALGSGMEPMAYRKSNGIQIENVIIDFDRLSDGLLPIETPMIPTLLLIIITITSICICLLIVLLLLLLACFVRRKRTISSRISPTAKQQIFTITNHVN